MARNDSLFYLLGSTWRLSNGIKNLIGVYLRNKVTQFLHLMIGSGQLGPEVGLLNNEDLLVLAGKSRNLQVWCPNLVIKAPI